MIGSWCLDMLFVYIPGCAGPARDAELPVDVDRPPAAVLLPLGFA